MKTTASTFPQDNSGKGQDIIVKGDRVNNLKNVDVTIPRNKMVVITGLSGSGKSSLAFDSLYAEGQRRYVESLSSYARQFLGRMPKPDCDFIRGLPPAIAIEQKVNTRNPRSTVGTSTEIYDYMRLLYGRVGHTYSPVTGHEVKRHTVKDVMELITRLPERTRVAIVAPITMPEGRPVGKQLEVYFKAGYTRLVDGAGAMVEIEDLLEHAPVSLDGYMLLIDRTVVSDQAEEVARVAESVETAFFEGHDAMSVLIFDADRKMIRHDFSTRFEADGITFLQPDEHLFNFNNPYGACPRCEGFGRCVGIDERLVVPDPTLSVYQDAVVCWRGEKMSECKHDFIKRASKLGFPIHRPYNKLTEQEKDLLWHNHEKDFPSIDNFFEWVQSQQHKIQYRVMLARYRGKTLCPECHGTRLRHEASYVQVGGKTITELVQMPVWDLDEWFKSLTLGDADSKVASRLLIEIRSRLKFLVDVGLGYLTLDRISSTLSGGESQRINLATSLGSSLVGSLYILDEPSIGLHPRDTDRLIGVLRSLQRIGNTVVVVEHDEDIMKSADYLIDVGPEAGTQGGNIVYEGIPCPARPLEYKDSYTMQYLNGAMSIPVPKHRRGWSSSFTLTGACEHNLKDVDVTIPLGVMTVVTGVSGSGKSTLIRDIVYKVLNRELGDGGEAPGAYHSIQGDYNRLSAVEMVNQSPIGRSSRSNPATYIKAYDEIRRLMAEQQLARQMGYTPGHFSFNTEGGRCEDCKGEGTITIEMQFLSDITIECETCHGKRFKPEILEVTYRGKNIHDILMMTVDNAIDFFSQDKDNLTATKIVSRLQPLSDVGLGYITLGQSSSTLSGGENQRVKLASFLSGATAGPTLFIFDEPTTGLHFHDILKLLDSFDRLIKAGHTVLIIEHHLDVIKSADWIIDLGPEGGRDGGRIVATGTPESLVRDFPDTYTARYLAPKLSETDNKEN